LKQKGGEEQQVWGMWRTWTNSKVWYKNRKKPWRLYECITSKTRICVDDLNAFVIDVLHFFGTSKVMSLHKITEVLPAVAIYFLEVNVYSGKKRQGHNFW